MVKADFEIALELATQLDFLFEKGNFDEKRLLCETVLKRLFVKDGKITKAELNAPFAIITRANGSGTVMNGGGHGDNLGFSYVYCLECDEFLERDGFDMGRDVGVTTQDRIRARLLDTHGHKSQRDLCQESYSLEVSNC